MHGESAAPRHPVRSAADHPYGRGRFERIAIRLRISEGAYQRVCPAGAAPNVSPQQRPPVSIIVFTRSDR